MVDAAKLRDYLKLPPDNNESLELFLAAAKEQLKTAGVDERETDPLYDLAVLQIAGFHYENRALTFGGSYQATAETNMRRMLNAIVLSLR